MLHPLPPYQIFPLGDAALTLDFGNTMDEGINREVISRFRQLQEEPLMGMVEAVPAYSSLTIYYDRSEIQKKINPGQTFFDWMRTALEQRLQVASAIKELPDREMRIPVCYASEFAPDLEHLATTFQLSPEEVIRLHTERKYKVYMLGFIPGFAYMGEVNEKIAMPRKPEPRPVQAGAVGIAGKQTGIYPLSSPGGWSIIGQTPLKLFDATREEPTLLKAGDTVEFYSINSDEFKHF